MQTARWRDIGGKAAGSLATFSLKTDVTVSSGGIEPPPRGSSVKLSGICAFKNQLLTAVSIPRSSLIKALWAHLVCALSLGAPAHQYFGGRCSVRMGHQIPQDARDRVRTAIDS